MIKWFLIMLILVGAAWGDTLATFTGTAMIEDSWIDDTAATTVYGARDSMRVGFKIFERTSYSLIYPIGIIDTLRKGAFSATACSLDLVIKAINANCDSLKLYAMRSTWDEAGVTYNRSHGTTNWFTAGANGLGKDYWQQIGGVNTNGKAAGNHVLFDLTTSFDSGWFVAGWKIVGYNGDAPITFWTSEKAGSEPQIRLYYTAEPSDWGWYGTYCVNGENRILTTDAAYASEHWIVNHLDTPILVTGFKFLINENGGSNGKFYGVAYNDGDSSVFAASKAHVGNGTSTAEWASVDCSLGTTNELAPGDSVFLALAFDHGGTDAYFYECGSAVFNDSVVLDLGTPILDPYTRDAQAVDASAEIRIMYSIKQVAAENYRRRRVIQTLQY